MRRRLLLAQLALAALFLAACGGGGSSDEDQIAATIEKAATSSDPSNCTKLETLRFVEQNTSAKGATAGKACREEAEAGEEVAAGVEVSKISVEGEKATAAAELEGGPLGSQTLELALVEEDGDWKLDRIEGFASYDGKALAEGFEKSFREEAGGLTTKAARCIAGEIAEASQAEAEELLRGGSRKALVEIAKGCA